MESVAVAREWPGPLSVVELWRRSRHARAANARRSRVALSYAERGGARRPCAPRSIGSGGLPTSNAGAGARSLESGMAAADGTAVTGEHVGMSSGPTCAGTEAEGICRQLQSGQLPDGFCSGAAGAQHSWLAGMDAAVACRSSPIHAQCACSSGMSSASRVARLANRARGRFTLSPALASTSSTSQETGHGAGSWLGDFTRNDLRDVEIKGCQGKQAAKPDNLSADAIEWQVSSGGRPVGGSRAGGQDRRKPGAEPEAHRKAEAAAPATHAPYRVDTYERSSGSVLSLAVSDNVVIPRDNVRTEDHRCGQQEFCRPGPDRRAWEGRRSRDTER